jgi:integrase
MADAKFYLQVRKDTEVNIPLILKYSFNGTRLEYYTGIRCDKDDYVPMYWKKRNAKPIKPSAPKSAEKNEECEIILNHVTTAKNAAKAAGTPLSVEYFRRYLDEKLKRKAATEPEKPVSLLDFSAQFIESMKTGINTKTGRKLSKTNAEKYSQIRQLLMDVGTERKKEIDFDDLGKPLYDTLITYMIEKKNYSQNTIGRKIRFLKTILHAATAAGVNTNIKFQSTFKAVTEKSDAPYLTETELNQLYNHDFSKQPRYDRVKDLFLVGAWTGLRFSDFSRIKPEHVSGDFIRLKQQKTTGTVTIPIHPIVRAIMAKYNGELPPAISPQKFNDYISEACKLAEINTPFQKNITRGGKVETTTAPKHEFISSHTARRSFATNAFLRGVNPVVIMAVTGHKSEADFLKYVKITDQERAELFRKQANWF